MWEHGRSGAHAIVLTDLGIGHGSNLDPSSFARGSYCFHNFPRHSMNTCSDLIQNKHSIIFSFIYRVYEREPCDCQEQHIVGSSGSDATHRLRPEPFKVRDYSGGHDVSSVCDATPWTEWAECTTCEGESFR